MSSTGSPGAQTVTYCLIPRDLAAELHEPLREFFRDDRSVRVVVDFRGDERRRSGERRKKAASRSARERRRLRSESGRRVDDRRAVMVPVTPPTLPRRARRHIDQIEFVQRVEPTAERAFDAGNARLVLDFQAGGADVFGELYMRNFDAVYSYLRVALKDSHEAEDVAQQVFMKVLQSLPSFELRRGKPFRAWLFRITRNEALEYLRKHGRIEVEDPTALERRRDDEQFEPETLDWVTDADLLFLIERLPAAQRQAITLRYMLGLTTEEMATVLERTPVAVRKLESRALRFLEERLAAVRARTAEPSRAARSPMLIRLRRAPVLRSRRFALGTGPKRRG